MSAIDTQAIYPVRGGAVRRQLRARRLTLFLLIMLGIGLEISYLALYPWLAGRSAQVDPLRQAWEGFLPLSSMLYKRLDWFSYISTFSWPGFFYGYLYPLLLLLGLLLFVLWLAVVVGNRAGNVILLRSSLYLRPVFGTLLFLTTILTITMVIAPIHSNELIRSMLQSGLYGKMVETYHLNPYTAPNALVAHDALQSLLAQLAKSPSGTSSTVGPVWMDISILISLVAHGEPVRVILSWRMLALIAHLLNVGLLWSLASAQKPIQRISTTLFYAWNPLVLILGVAYAHPEIVFITLLLLSLLSLQRGAILLGWVFALLASLICLPGLVLLPLIFVYAIRRAWSPGCGWFLLSLLGIISITALVVLLAYVPYWQGWGVSGMLAGIRAVFWQESAVNSLNAAVLSMPVHLPANLYQWVVPNKWSEAALIIMGLYVFIAIWFLNTFEALLQWSGGLLLLWIVLQPVCWPWYLILPLVVIGCSTNRKEILLMILLLIGALISYYFWQWSHVWEGQALVTIGVPCLIWGWALFFYSTWQMVHGDWRGGGQAIDEDSRPQKLRRPPWFSRPNWSSRPLRNRN
ncbi:hypothetical protein [Dictyobacter kobayashii]|uniref:Alpha-(1->6)-mannopyranosyltransferase A n=1 Tax=Dictyobacter kobayashii TaxID=2014872 RepID=A0A402AGX4_9CHLR|nr:hypothetical protein [Dictyobacter kobayashii]GCE18371.1 hypothetical protein KDK_21710 [Dictyobacter kobayashii]